jgi:hypothetical protein
MYENCIKNIKVKKKTKVAKMGKDTFEETRVA